MQTPSYIEDHISQIPALQMLMKLGWKYLTPEQALKARGERESNVLFEGILKEWLSKNNSIEYKGKSFPFSEANINEAVRSIRDLPDEEGFMAANQNFYELITLGKSLNQSVLSDRKSFSLKYVDWEHPENNTFHVTEELSVLRSGRTDHYRTD